MADPVEAALRGAIALWQEEGRGEYSYDIAAQLCRDARALLDALPEIQAATFNLGYSEGCYDERHGRITNRAANPFRRETGDQT